MERRATPAGADRLHDHGVAAAQADPEDDPEAAADARANGACRADRRSGEQQLHAFVGAKAGGRERQRIEVDRPQGGLRCGPAAHDRDPDQGEQLHRTMVPPILCIRVWATGALGTHPL